MKRNLTCIFLALLMLLFSGSAALAAEAEPYAMPEDDLPIAPIGRSSDTANSGDISVPKIEITTENGNGAALEKADGYVNAQISVTDTDGSVISDTVLFKVRGNSTAMTHVLKKAFTFKFEKKTNVLKMGKGKKWALLANCFDPTLLRNYVVFDFAQTMGLPYTSQQRFVRLWLDGAYRGCYTLYEPIGEGKDRVDIDIESNDGKKDFLLEYEATRTEDDVTYLNVNGLRFAISEPEAPDDEQLAYITDVMTDITNALRSGDEAQARERIDVDSFAKFYLLNEYAKTGDFGLSSVFFFCKDGKLYAGPPWDYDLSLGNLNGELNSASAKAGSVSDGIMQSGKNFYRWLCDKAWFREEIRRVYHRYYPYVESIGADGGLLDALREEYGGLFAENFSVWSVNRWWLNYQKRPLATYEENYRFLKNWCGERHAWLSSYFEVGADTVLCGDADNDGEITVLDATAIQRVLVDFEVASFDIQAADIDGDGLNIMDATVIQRWLAGYKTSGNVGKLTN